MLAYGATQLIVYLSGIRHEAAAEARTHAHSSQAAAGAAGSADRGHAGKRGTATSSSVQTRELTSSPTQALSAERPHDGVRKRATAGGS
jgi:type IV secretory pathway TrbL component